MPGVKPYRAAPGVAIHEYQVLTKDGFTSASIVIDALNDDLIRGHLLLVLHHHLPCPHG